MNRRFFIVALPLTLAGCQTAGDLAPALTQAAVAGIAGQRDRLTFSAITVRTTGTAFEGLQAGTYRSRLAADLQAALTQELSDRMSPLGLPLIVDLTRFGVAGVATTAFGEGESVLAGNVRVMTAANTVHATHSVSADAGSRNELIAGALLGGAAASADGIYQRLLSDFAEETREAVLGRESIGAQIIRNVTD